MVEVGTMTEEVFPLFVVSLIFWANFEVSGKDLVDFKTLWHIFWVRKVSLGVTGAAFADNFIAWRSKFASLAEFEELVHEQQEYQVVRQKLTFCVINGAAE